MIRDTSVLRLLVWLQGHGTLCMAASVVVGLAFQDLARVCAPLVVYAATGTMLLSLVRLDIDSFIGHARRPGLAIAIVAWTILVVPTLALALAHYTPLTVPVGAGMVLIAATPSIMSVAAYCIFLGTDAALLTLVSLAATALCVATLPAFAAWAPGDVPGLTFAPLLIRTFTVVGIAFGGAALIHRIVPRASIIRHVASIDGVIVILIIVSAIGIVDGLWAVLTAQPLLSIEYFVLTLVLNLGLQFATGLVFRSAGRINAASAALVGGCRNMALLLGLVIGRVTPELQLFLVMAQLQLFLLPALMRPAYAWFGVTPVFPGK